MRLGLFEVGIVEHPKADTLAQRLAANLLQGQTVVAALLDAM